MTPAPIIEVAHLSCQMGQRALLQDLNWQLFAKEHTVIFGQNGCGKTTLLSTILNYLPITEGSITIFGLPLAEQNIFNLRQQIGFVSASFFDKYFHQESAWQIVLSGLSGTLSLPEATSNSQLKLAKELLQTFELAEQADYPYALLSKGQQQKVLLARALIAEPAVLILDEPASGLDILARERLFRLLEYLAEHSETTMIYVTHYAEEILPLFAHSLFMREGQIIQQGLTKDLFTTHNLTALFHYPLEVYTHEQRYVVSFKQTEPPIIKQR